MLCCVVYIRHTFHSHFVYVIVDELIFFYGFKFQTELDHDTEVKISTKMLNSCRRAPIDRSCLRPRGVLLSLAFSDL